MQKWTGEGVQRAIGKPSGTMPEHCLERENSLASQDAASQKGASPPFSPPIAEGGKSVYVVYSLSHATFTVPSGPFLCFAMMISPTFLSAVSGS